MSGFEPSDLRVSNSLQYEHLTGEQPILYWLPCFLISISLTQSTPRRQKCFLQLLAAPNKSIYIAFFFNFERRAYLATINTSWLTNLPSKVHSNIMLAVLTAREGLTMQYTRGRNIHQPHGHITIRVWTVVMTVLSTCLKAILIMMATLRPHNSSSQERYFRASGVAQVRTAVTSRSQFPAKTG